MTLDSSAIPLKMRVFLALPFTDQWKEKLAVLSGKYAFFHGAERVLWVPKENYHITVVFIGSVLSDTMPVFEHTVTEVTKDSVPFDLEFADIEVRQSIGRGMVWCRLKKSDEFRALVRALTRALGLRDSSKHESVAHVTLARFRGVVPECRIPLESLPPYKAGNLVLFRSHLSSGGSRYRELRRWQLGS